MVMEIEIKGFIVAYFSSYGDQTVPSHYSFMNWKPDSPEYVVLAEHTHKVEFEVPASYIPERVAVLRTAQATARVKAEETVAEIEETLQKLLCLEGPL